LAENLSLKIIGIPTIDDFKAYNVETPYLKGYLRRGHSKRITTYL